MDTKLRQILELALRPETGDGESSAALAAARRLVAKQGMDLLGAPTPERVVYREKVVFRNPLHTFKMTFTLKIPAMFNHTMIERIFLDAEHVGCEIQLVKCKTQGEAILSGTVIEFRVLGTKDAVKRYESMIDSYIDEMNRRQGTTRHTNAPQPQPAEKPKSWFSKLFGG
jgi:hypothetical protein